MVAGVEVGCGLVGTGRPRESGKEEIFILKLLLGATPNSL